MTDTVAVTASLNKTIFLKGLRMKKTVILTLVIACALLVLAGGCLTVRDHGQIISGMPKDERDKFADQVACKVAEKLKAEHGCTKAMPPAAAEPNNPCK